HSVTAADVARALQAEKEGTLNPRSAGDLIVRTGKDGKVVRMKDVARVETEGDRHEEVSLAGRGEKAKTAAGLGIVRGSDRARKPVAERLAGQIRKLPAGVRVSPLHDHPGREHFVLTLPLGSSGRRLAEAARHATADALSVRGTEAALWI